MPSCSDYVRFRTLVWLRYFLPFCVLHLRVHLVSYCMCNRLYYPYQSSITQRPARHYRLHTLRLVETPFDHTYPDRCLYSCWRLNINSSQLVLEVAHCCTVLILLYCEFIILLFKIQSLYVCVKLCMNICNDICRHLCLYLYMDVYVHKYI